jgi:hypothetical protein
MIIGCDYHPGFQQIAMLDTETGELRERRLAHREEAEAFYRDLGAQGVGVRVGMEASGQARWFERLISELGFELWIGDAAEIRTKRVRKQKTDRQDAQLILRLLLEDRFPRIWVPSGENRDLRKQPRANRDHFPYPRGFKAAIDNEKKPTSTGQHNNNLRCQRPKPDQRVIASKSRSIRYEAVDPECHEAQTSFDKHVTRSTDPLS